MMKKIKYMFVFIVIVIMFTGCSENINHVNNENTSNNKISNNQTTSSAVKAYVSNVTFEKEHIQMIGCGKCTSFIHHDAKYLVTLNYKGTEYKYDNKTYYNIYKDKIGQLVDCTLITNDDGFWGTEYKLEPTLMP